MDEPKSLDSLFTKKIFRIPDYQRGYAWQKSQLKDFWEDLINLSSDRSHYAGVLTLNEADPDYVAKDDNEYWLIEDHGYTMYHIVDGQQRLTTFVIFLQSFIDVVKSRAENEGKENREIYITESLNLEVVINDYLFMTRPTGVKYRTYKFGYTVDNPSYEYLRHRIFKESGSPSVDETFYTLNLQNAKLYFYKQLEKLYAESGIDGLRDVYKKLTQRFLFNEYVIKNEFNVFVAFETMNNRGKRLSDLELLKNRLIYLTTLYTKDKLDEAGCKNLRDAINSAWKKVYHQLGRNSNQPLNDDDFLKAHWIMYFQYSRKKGNAYTKFLLDEQFSPQRIHKKIEHKVALNSPEEHRDDSELDDSDGNDGRVEDGITVDCLPPDEIKEYVDSLGGSAVHWFNSHYPDLAEGLSDGEKNALNCLNRIGMGYFRPLIMSVFKNESNPEKRIDLLKHIERFVFIVFRLSQARGNYKDSEFYSASRELNRGQLTLPKIKDKLDATMKDYFHDDGGAFNSKYFYDYLYKRFNSGDKNGYYGWNGLRYFLYEYELDLLSQNRQKKVPVWEDLLKTPKDKVSIEHIFPQTPTNGWKGFFASVDEEKYPFYSGSIGNLLLLSMSINSSLQNADFADKKKPRTNGGKKTRNGYSDGSHSEIEVAQYEEWTPEAIEERGLLLLDFMEKRWDLRFESKEAKKALLFISADMNSPSP